jgi:ribulose-5-phosphate 4-epimerase/fuculose-1-phosphate aldolase
VITAHELKREVSHYSVLLHERGWVANHDGNVSARLDAKGRFLVTPTATSKRKCSPESIVACDAAGVERASGRLRGAAAAGGQHRHGGPVQAPP